MHKTDCRADNRQFYFREYNMSKVILFFISGLLLCTGCKKNESGGVTPPDTTVQTETLQPLSVYPINVNEPSGLFYCPKSNSLYTIPDGHTDIYELNMSGVIVRTIPVSSLDMEGIVLSKNYDTLFVVEEGTYKIVKYLQNGTKAGSFTIVTSPDPKHGLEGITLDNQNNIYLLNEKSPCLLVKLNYNGQELWRKELSYTTDISDICYDEKTGSLWIVSDESKMLLQLSMDGSLLKKWNIPITQAEGLAMTNDKLYMISDAESKLYSFKRP